MIEPLEQETDVLLDAEQRPAPILDLRTLREPIRRLNPRSPLCLPPTAALADAVEVMREHHIGCVLITEDERIVGILTERDLLLRVEMADLTRPVRMFMTPDPETLRLDHPILYALNRMSVGGYRHVPLVDEAGRPSGIVSVKDIVHYIVAFFPNEVLTLPPDLFRAEVWRERDGG